MNVPPQLSSLGRMNTLASRPKAKRFSFGMSWHVVLAAIGAVLNGPSGRIRSPALARATGRQSRSAQRTARSCFRVVVFVIIGSCPSLPAGDCGAGVVLLTGTAIVPPPGFIVCAGDGRLSRRPAWVSCASSWRLPVFRGRRRAAEMLAVRWHARGDVRVEEVPPPAPPGPGEVQLRVRWCGICGTDLEEWLSGPVFIPAAVPHPLTGARRRSSSDTNSPAWSWRSVLASPGRCRVSGLRLTRSSRAAAVIGASVAR